MKQFFIYIMSVFMLAACSSGVDELVTDPDRVVDKEPAIPEYDENVNVVMMPNVMHEEGWEDEPTLTRTAFWYDYTAGKMAFLWKVNDEVGIYPIKWQGTQGSGDLVNVDPKDSQQQRWTIHKVEESLTGTASVGVFDADDEHIMSYPAHEYVAVSPLIMKDLDYRDIPVTYMGQIQSQSSKMGLYAKGKNQAPYSSLTTTEEERNIALEDYVLSEKEATKHLAAYDYLVDKRAANGVAHMHFDMKRMGAVVRFYLVAPAHEVFDSLQLYNQYKLFTLKGTMDASSEEYKITPTVTSHCMSLKLGENGFDYTDCRDDAPYDEYYYSNSYKQLIIAYMMVAPVDLTDSDSNKKSVLYLHGHNKSTSERHVYKVALSQKNLQRDILYQWSARVGTDEPIVLTPITIQEWENGTGFTNGDGGKGTEGW